MASRQAQFTAQGINVAAISYDSVAILKTFGADRKITYPLLSDAGSKTIKMFGIHNKKGLPFPVIYLVDRKGVIQQKFLEKSYTKRPNLASVIIRSFGAPKGVAKTAVEADGLEIKTWQSDAGVGGRGGRVSFATELNLPKGATIAKGKLTLKPDLPQGVKLDQVDIPAPAKGGKHRGSLLILCDVTVPKAARLKGALKDGAIECTATLTYIIKKGHKPLAPVSVPLKWTLNVGGK